MRNRLRPDPSVQYSLTGVPQNWVGDSAETSPEKSLSELGATVAPGSGSFSTDLATDLLLHEIAERVRLSTQADGVAIALTRSGELVCRAAAGRAPELGIRLNPYSGLSGLCLRGKTIQRCDDTETDPRVDVAACRNLKVRSILVAPIVSKGHAVGLLEAFSSQPSHFKEHDSEKLRSFCGQLFDDVHHRDPKVSPSHLDQTAEVVDDQPETPAARLHFLGDRQTALLTGAVIASALILGCIIGILGEHNIARRNPVASAGHKVQAHSLSPSTAAAPKSNKPPPPSSASLTKPGLTGSENNGVNPDGGLVISQNGKIIFREPPRVRIPSEKPRPLAQQVENIRPTDDAGAASPAQSIIPAGKTELLSPGPATDYVSYRAEPIYPDAARKQHIEGQVLLKILVGKDGGVQQVQILDGNPLLATAASDALVRWKFKPLMRMGQPVEFKTQITVNFKLP